jgi:hypothetical protein
MSRLRACGLKSSLPRTKGCSRVNWQAKKSWNARPLDRMRSADERIWGKHRRPGSGKESAHSRAHLGIGSTIVAVIYDSRRCELYLNSGKINPASSRANH